MSSEKQYYLNRVGKYIGMNSIEKKDIEKVEKVINENIKIDFFKDWICFKSGGSVLFLDKNKWIINDKSNFENYGFFNFKKISSISVNLPLLNSCPNKPFTVPENTATPSFLFNNSSKFK